MTTSTGISEAMSDHLAPSLPSRYCPPCEVMWAHEMSDDCWLCGSVGEPPPPPQTTEERAQQTVDTLLSLR